jgi:Fe-S cluster assembly iron-binding protein IscA
LRIYIVGTGYGIDYQFSYSEYQLGDFEFPTFQSKILVDCVSIHYLEDSTLDYTDDSFDGGFVVKYPKIYDSSFGNFSI